MTHHQVLVFGSFTEDEIKSLQIQPTESDLTIKFGSLDSETLKSVGIFSTIPKKPENSTGSHPTKLLHNESTLNTVCTTEKAREVISTCIDDNGSNHDLWPAQCSDSVIELQQNDMKLSLPHVSVTVSDPQNHLSPKQLSTESSSSSSKPVVDEAFFDSSEGFELVDSKEISCDASNEPGATARNLLPRGLVNLGNLCFLNATLQALLCCSPFVQLLQELRTRNIPLIGYPTLHAFVDFISEFDIPCNSSSKKKQTFVLETGSPLRPVMFEIVLKNFSPDVSDSLLGSPRQEDAQEFLSYIMHQMHDELLKLDGQSPNVTGKKPSLVNSMNDEDDDDYWETVGPKNRTAITRTQSFIPSELSATFGGQLRSVVKARGNKASATIQPYLLLHLNISPEHVWTIEDALHLFSAPETLEGYRASAAGKAEVVSASKSVKILEPSDMMILHLMRFSYGSQGSTKLHKPVHFSFELVLGRELLVSPSTEIRRYELVATITHHGRDPSKGHYTADTCHSSGKWLHCDDASVAVIPKSKVLHDQAYILFYKRL